jgi:hypothetical protein
MDLTKRIALALGILVLDAVFFFLPITAIFLAYVLIVNPPWFRQFINRLEPSDH